MNKFSIGIRLSFGFALVLFLSVVITAFSAWQLQATSKAAQGVIDAPLAKERLLTDWHLFIHTAVRRTTAIAKSKDPALAVFFADEQKQSAASTTAIIKKIEPLMVSAKEKALFDDIGKLRKIYSTSRDEVIRLKKENLPDEADKLLDGTFIPAAHNYISDVNELLNLQREALNQSAVPIREANERARNGLIALGALSLILGAFCAVIITRSITGPLAQALDTAKRVSSGDLTNRARTDARDETGSLLNALSDMQEALAVVIRNIRQSSDSISVASSEIAKGNQDLSARTEQTAANLEESAASLEELTSTVQQSALAAKKAQQMAASAQTIAGQGGAVVTQVISTMDEINASSSKISDIISVIDGIAFQTNILALNAAVEAARAGEQGRGFAVVASEVRSLAGRSADAAKEIKALINASVQRVNNGAQLVREAGNTMGQIVQSVQQVTQEIDGIATSASEQSVGISQVNEAVNKLDQMTQQNAALVEQSAAAAQSLSEQAYGLLQTVSNFKVDGRQIVHRAT